MKKIYILLFLMSSVCFGQNLNFTIDTAVDNDAASIITETIVSGVDTFVLTINHSGSEALDNIGGGDLIFYHSAINPLDPHVLSITRNGNPANFTLNGIDYDTLGDGTISITNQDNAEISSPTFYPVGAGAINITSTVNATDISSFNILPGASGDLNNFGFHNINVDMIEPCVPPSGSVVFASQDCGVGTFLAEVNVTDLGGGSPSIFDGTTTTTVTTTGVYNFGPYPIGTPINFTLLHGVDTACNVNLGTIVDTCPPPCLSPVGTATLSSQDCGAGTFFIDVNVTDLGSGSPIIFDGTTSTPVTATGVTTVGPYVTGAAILIALQHGSDNTCDADLEVITATCDEIIFTIDTAIDDNTASIITETIVKDGDTFVLTVSHSGSETLDNLGGGDLVFYHSATNPLDPHVLSITKNGFPTNFSLKGVDYNTGEAGTISITNQDGLVIASSATYPVGDGAIMITNSTNATGISSFNILPNDGDDLNDFGFHNIKVDIIDTCAPAIATATITGQDCITGQFFVDIDVTNLGNGSPTIFDGTSIISVPSIGVYNFGPYASGASINYTLQHGNDATCDVDLGALTYTCPAPSNDECSGAIAVICGETVTGSTQYATNSGNDVSPDVFYSFTDTVLQDVTLATCATTTDFNTIIRVFTDCPQTNQLTFNDQFCGDQSQVTFTAQPNTTYYIMVDGYLNGSFGNYELNVTCAASVPAPGNDLCSNPTALTIGATLSGETTAGATDDSTGDLDDTTCNSFSFISDVWYTFQAPSSGEVTITTVISGSSDQANVAVYSSIDCSQLDVDSIGCSAGNGGEVLVLTGLTAAATYYVRVWSDGVASAKTSSSKVEGTYSISASDATLGTSEFDNNGFSYFPNPVTSVLTVKSQNTISRIRVLNVLGQVVLSKIPNASIKYLNMSSLQSGAYFVEVSMVKDDRTEIIRIIKE